MQHFSLGTVAFQRNITHATLLAITFKLNRYSHVSQQYKTEREVHLVQSSWL